MNPFHSNPSLSESSGEMSNESAPCFGAGVLALFDVVTLVAGHDDPSFFQSEDWISSHWWDGNWAGSRLALPRLCDGLTLMGEPVPQAHVQIHYDVEIYLARLALIPLPTSKLPNPNAPIVAETLRTEVKALFDHLLPAMERRTGAGSMLILRVDCAEDYSLTAATNLNSWTTALGVQEHSATPCEYQGAVVLAGPISLYNASNHAVVHRKNEAPDLPCFYKLDLPVVVYHLAEVLARTEILKRIKTELECLPFYRKMPSAYAKDFRQLGDDLPRATLNKPRQNRCSDS